MALGGTTVTSTAAAVTPTTIDTTVTSGAGGVTGSVITLTTAADAGGTFNGTAGDDTFVGTETTLSSSDILDGSTGTDTLKYASSGNTAVTESGFEISNIEKIQVTSDAVGGTTFDVTATTGVTTLINSNSSTDLTLAGGKTITELEVNSVSGGNTTLTYDSATVAGTADAMAISLNGNHTIAGAAIGTVTVGGVETFNVTTTGSASTLTGLASTTLSTVTVAGSQSLTIGTALAASVTTVNASAQTAGGINIALTNAANVAVTGGAGSDSVNFTGALTSSDSFNGGSGRDTITANNAEYTTGTYAVASKISNVETIVISDSLTGAFTANSFTGDDTIKLATGYTTGASVTGMESNYTLVVQGANTGKTITAAITNATNTGTSDILNLQLGTATTVPATDGAGNAGIVNLTGIETVNVLANGTLAAGTDAVVLADTTTTTSSLSKVVVTGANGLTISSTNVGTASVTEIDASAATGNINMNALAVKATGSTIKGGAGNDVISGGAGVDTITAGAGNDTINGTVGADVITLGDGVDKVVYTAATQSTTNSGVDVISDFTSGTDLFDISALLTTTPGSYKGNQATFSASQNAMVASDGVLDVAYQQDEKVLWLDMNDDGLLNAADFRISLTNTASLTATDIGLNSTGNTITLTAPSAVVNTTTNTNASATSTVYADTITSTFANLSNATIDSSTSSDTLNVSDAITGTFTLQTAGVGTGAALTSVEVINLQAGSTAVVTAQTYAASTNGSVAINNTSASSASSVTLSTVTNATTTDKNSQSFTSTGTGVDTVVAGITNAAAYNQSVSLGAGADSLTLGGTHTGTLAGGADADTLTIANVAAADISGATVSGFETLIFGTANALTMTSAQWNAFTTVTDAGGADSVVFSDAATITTSALATAAGVETFTLGNFANTVTMNSTANTGAAQTVAGGTSTDILNVTTTTGQQTTFTGNTGTDTINITGGMAAAFTVTTAGGGAAALGQTGVETLNVSGASTTNALTLVSAVVDDLLNINASGVTGGGISITATGLTAAGNRVITLTSGDDTITNLKGTTGTLTVDFGTGATDTVSDLAVASTGLFTIKAGVQAGGTHTINFAATTANLVTASATGTLLDFSGDVTAIAVRAVGAAGVNVAGQVIIDNATAAANTAILWDVDGNGTYSTGDVEINLVGQAYTGATASIVSGNLQM